jgi:hypothetical protein
VGDVLRCLGQFNATYSFVAKFLQQAAKEQLLEGRLVINALPKSERAYNAAGGNLALPDMFQTDMRNSAGSGDEVTSTEEGWTATPETTESTADNSSSEKDSRSASRFKWPWQ